MMRLRDLSIGTQLRLGLGTMLALVVGLAILAETQSKQLWLQTKGLYEHPLAVRRAVAEIQVQILSMHRAMKDLCIVDSEPMRETILQDIDAREGDVHRQFTLLFDRYLGPRSDVEAAEKAFVQWKVIREDTVRLLREGKTAEAVRRTLPADVGGGHVDRILGEMEHVSDFARARSLQFYAEAEAEYKTLVRNMALIVVAILALVVAVAWLLMRGIRTPLKELTATTDRFRQGALDARSPYTSANEFGHLSVAFNAMADSIQMQLQVDERAAQLAGVMLREDEVHAFSRELLKVLIEHTGAQVAAIYFLNSAKTAYEHFESIGLGTGGRTAFSAKDLEGELGRAVATRSIQRIRDIPADSRFSFAATSGDFAPRDILTIPVLADREVTAVVSLASVKTFEPAAILLIEETWSVLTARVNGVLAFRSIQDLAARLEQQNVELEAQKRELAAQADELTVQNAELNAQKRHLDEANRLKSTFLSTMSHELRTPLNSIIALSGVLNRRLAGSIPADEYGYLDVIERNGRLLLTLINDVLHLSRIEAGHEDLRTESFSLQALVGDVTALIEPQAQEKGITLANRVGNDLPPLVSDPAQCRHILQNLVGNAVKFTAKGSVEVTARRVHDAVEVDVRDTGIGIAADQIPHIFEEFRQVDDGASRKYGGVGLGLAIARKCALLLHGSLTVRSVLGQGSTFTLRLPLALPPSGTAEAPQPETPPLATVDAPRGRSLLLVDDNAPAVVQMTDILAEQGYHLRVARNGREALDLIRERLPDGVILDLMMPEMDGLEVLKVIRSTDETAGLPVLILTAKHISKDELSFLKQNHIFQIIQKGDISKAQLLASVAKLMTPPAAQAALPSTPRPVRAAPRPPRVGAPVVLVVEDNPDNLSAMRALLRDRYTIVEATNGKVGVEAARRHQPDLILMDIAMPVMDGFAALATLREDPSLRDTPIIAVSASAMTGDRESILAHGFDAYLPKPVDAALLQQTLREVLHGKP